MEDRLGPMRGLLTRATAARWHAIGRSALTLCAVGGVLAGAPAASAATGVHTVSWAADGSADGSGTGTLLGQTVTYSTVPAPPDAGTTVALDWNSALGTNDAVGSGASSQTAGVLGVGVSAESTVSFSSTVVNPIIYAALGDPVTSLEFIDHPFTLLDANNATANFGLVDFDNAAANTPDDSFAVRVNGTFGPGNPLRFIYYNYSANTYATMAFTVGVTDAPPTVTITSPADGARFGLLRMLLERPRAQFACADDIAVATCSATVDGRPIADGARLPTGLGAHTVTVTATDDAGNSHSEARTYHVALL